MPRAKQTARQEMQQIPPRVDIDVNGLAGPVGTVEARTDCTVLQVHKAIRKELGVPVDRQTLLKGCEKLAAEETLGSLLPEEAATPLKLTLTLVIAPEAEELVVGEASEEEAAEEDGEVEPPSEEEYILGSRPLPKLSNKLPPGVMYVMRANAETVHFVRREPGGVLREVPPDSEEERAIWAEIKAAEELGDEHEEEASQAEAMEEEAAEEDGEVDPSSEVVASQELGETQGNAAHPQGDAPAEATEQVTAAVDGAPAAEADAEASADQTLGHISKKLKSSPPEENVG